ncbi:DUF4192 domain-containing protein [Actinoplanes sp. DH11]|uniref:DUF4192 domain-containing protein n=1 Tax=Actinoplanes sp. DH11 TaxID=2857011 RepID=UPI001E385E6A|nr:DUF4192 domain-containing protein [Actinoplanes sp. DH11]
MTDRPTIQINNPFDTAAIAPYLLGYQPHDSLVILAIRDSHILFGANAGLEATQPANLARVADALVREHVEAVLLVGYGDHKPIVTAVADATAAIRGHDIEVLDTIRVADNRIWHPLCDDPQCQINGVAFDPTSTAAAATATWFGIAVQPSRDAVAATLDPVTGVERDLMTLALDNATTVVNDLIDGDNAAQHVVEFTNDLVVEAITTAITNERLADDRAAQLLILLRIPALRDRALNYVHGDDHHLQAFTDLTRRASDDLVCGPALLLTFAALQAGHGALARIAVRRALASEPDNELADLLERITAAGISPHTIRSVLREHD